VSKSKRQFKSECLNVKRAPLCPLTFELQLTFELCQLKFYAGAALILLMLVLHPAERYSGCRSQPKIDHVLRGEDSMGKHAYSSLSTTHRPEYHHTLMGVQRGRPQGQGRFRPCGHPTTDWLRL